jgi:hypothetical protein
VHKSRDNVYYPDTLVGTDSHTTMINGIGVVGWGVGGIEAEAGMLGQPIYFLTPEVVGVNKRIWVKIFRGVAVSPKYGNRIGCKRVVHLFRGPTDPLLVFKGKHEPVTLVEGQLVSDAREACVIHSATWGVNSLSSVQRVKKLGTLLNGIVCITGKGGTKAGFHLLDGRPILSPSNQRLGRSVEGENRDM